VILCSAAVALLTKAFYAPALLLTLFMPKGKWAADREERRQYVSAGRYALLVCGVLLISMLPYILPMFQGVISSSMRGETSTHPIEQLHFILEDPARWFRILFAFQSRYFSFSHSSGLLTSFAYQGLAPGWQALYILLVLLAFTDKKETDRALEKSWGVRIAGFALMYIATCVICLCLYITFTTIGAETIDGVQPRYLSPVVFPVLMLAGSGFAARLVRIDKEWKQGLYNGIAFTVSLGILYITIYTNCVGKF